MNRRGFALVAVLWVTVALTSLALVTASHAQVSAANAESRVLAVRGRWAADACLAVAQSTLDERAAEGRLLEPLPADTLSLADGSQCATAMTDTTDAVLVTAQGWVPGGRGSAVIDVLLVSAGSRLAPVRRRVW